MANPFSALLFDMDGLLLDSERQFMEALVEIGTPLGFEAATLEAFFLTLVGTSSAQTSIRLAEFLPSGVDATAFEKQWRLVNAARRNGPVPLRPAVGHVLPALARAGHRMAVVTSTKRAPALEHLKHAGLLSYFELVVAGDEVSANKPDPAPYLHAAKALGVDPRTCAAFEDSDTGTHAAVAAGCITTQIPDLRPAGLPLPDLGQHIAQDLAVALQQIRVLDHTVA
ncbi:HAD family phosphatase [Octadecabacter sp. 1_MG-2023]|uniref:HAD family hydrolase n=1 Tax=unclassified Octadecabacter TaxID=196158 RepID=UPI001C088471|nr:MULTISPECIES: HAD family phosphatase [unclassified Octadecabacter]MBU2993550.1 HAD family phosphatase [Octadecabacter sp. B2R22]MDO6735606.1 HAD family phosphatase [Octadecabacter sp. 1_MG-2023]